MQAFQTFWSDSYFLSISRFGHFYKIKLSSEKPDSRKKRRFFSWHFDVLLCITDQLWAWQDGWTLKKGSRRFFWSMGCISKIFFRKPQSADLCRHGQNLLILLANFSRDNFHLIFCLLKVMWKLENCFLSLALDDRGYPESIWVSVMDHGGPVYSNI